MRTYISMDYPIRSLRWATHRTAQPRPSSWHLPVWRAGWLACTDQLGSAVPPSSAVSPNGLQSAPWPSFSHHLLLTRPLCRPRRPRCRSFSHDSRYLSIAGEQQVLDVENVESGHSLGRLHLRARCEGLLPVCLPGCSAWRRLGCQLLHQHHHSRELPRPQALLTASYGCLIVRYLAWLPVCSPEDLCWNPRHHMLAYAGEYGRDGSGAEFGEVHFRWK
jgi:hypothetical protein